MSFQKFAKWAVSESGRKWSYYFAAGCSSAVLIGHILPHTLLVDKYQEFLHLYCNGFTVPLTKETEQKFEKVLDMLQIPDNEKLLYKPFNTVGFNVLGIGTSFSKYGARIGIPANFSYKSEDEVDRSRITLNGEKVIWDVEAGQKLLKSLIISDEAQLYAIASQVKLRDTPKVMIDTVAGCFSTMLMYGISSTINQKYNFFTKPLLLRLVLYGLSGAFCIGNYFLIKDFSQVYFEQKIDKELKQNPVFARGGKEYYTKLLLRNMALRILLGKEGESLYGPLGNENNFIRTKKIGRAHV